MKVFKALTLAILVQVITINLFAQDNDSVCIQITVDGAAHTLKFIKDPEYTSQTSLPDSFFNTPVDAELGYIAAGWNYKVVYKIKVPQESNILVYKLEFTKPSQTIIGCVGTTCDSDLKVKAYENTTGTINSMEMYRYALNLQQNGNVKEANKMLQKSAQCGNVLSMYQLWQNYRTGTGCAKNKKKAEYWFWASHNFGYCPVF